MKRTKLIVANWKMHFTIPESLKFLTAFQFLVKTMPSDVEVVIAPPFTALYALAEVAAEMGIKVAAQNLHEEEEGAFTGEVSGAFLKDVGVQYVIVGHSERRHIFGETEERIHKKLVAAFANDLIPIFCVGETLEERENKKTFDVLRCQLSTGIDKLTQNNVEEMVIAYEPVWAIGTGKTAASSDIQEVLQWIREYVRQEKTRILYGGSVKPEKARSIATQPAVDGFLVGSASLEPESFVEIVKSLI